MIRRKSCLENKESQDINEDPDSFDARIRVFMDIFAFLVFLRRIQMDTSRRLRFGFLRHRLRRPTGAEELQAQRRMSERCPSGDRLSIFFPRLSDAGVHASKIPPLIRRRSRHYSFGCAASHAEEYLRHRLGRSNAMLKPDPCLFFRRSFSAIEYHQSSSLCRSPCTCRRSSTRRSTPQ